MKKWRFYLKISLSGAIMALALMACQSPGANTGSATPGFEYLTDADLQNSSNLSYEQQMQQKEVLGYIAATSDRRFMQLPNGADLTVTGALRQAHKVEFDEPTTPEHRYSGPLFLNSTSAWTQYRPAFRSDFSNADTYSGQQ